MFCVIHCIVYKEAAALIRPVKVLEIHNEKVTYAIGEDRQIQLLLRLIVLHLFMLRGTLWM